MKNIFDLVLFAKLQYSIDTTISSYQMPQTVMKRLTLPRLNLPMMLNTPRKTLTLESV
jgi:hypothetical protein